MIASNKNFRRLSFTVAILVVLVSNASAQIPKLTLEGMVKDGKSKLSGAVIIIKKNGKQVSKTSTGGNGKFFSDLPLGDNYLVEITKPGYVTKRLSIETSTVPPNQVNDRHTFPMEVGLFRELEGLDVSILDKPIGKIQYNRREGYFDFDEAYTRSIQDRLAKLQRELKERMRKEKEYLNVIAAADRAFQIKDYKNAQQDYEKATKMKPEETYPKDQINKINTLLVQHAAEDEAKRLADEKAAADAEAKKLAEEEAARKASENEAKRLADEKAAADAEAKRLAEEEAARKAAEDEAKRLADEKAAAKAEGYDQALAKADDLFNGKFYKNAKTAYNSALGIKPDEQYPKDQIAICDRKLKAIADALAKKKAEEEKARLEAAVKAKDDKYNALIAKADKELDATEYESARKDYTTASRLKPSEVYPKDRIKEINQKIAALKESATTTVKTEVKDSLGLKTIGTGSSKDGTTTAKDVKGKKDRRIRTKAIF